MSIESLKLALSNAEWEVREASRDHDDAALAAKMSGRPAPSEDRLERAIRLCDLAEAALASALADANA